MQKQPELLGSRAPAPALTARLQVQDRRNQRDKQHPFGSNLDHRLRHDGLQFCTILQKRRVKQLLVPQPSWTELTGATCSVHGHPESLKFSFCRRETRQKYNRTHNYRFKQVGWVGACVCAGKTTQFNLKVPT